MINDIIRMMFQLESLSKNRLYIMGFAIIWVMLFHLQYSENLLDGVNMFDIGYGGVDIFLFFSGFGLYYSLRKKPDVKYFYKKRFIRVFPTYWIAVILFYYLLLQVVDFPHMLLMLSTLGFWVGKSSEWYISALVVFYMFFPLFVKIFNKKPYVSTVVMCILSILLTLAIGTVFLTSVSFFTARISIFCIGVLFAWLTINDCKVPSFTLMILSLVGFIVVFACYLVFENEILIRTGLYFFPFILITPGLCIFLSLIFNRLPSKILDLTLGLAGTYSLELFLAHGKLLSIIPKLINIGVPRFSAIILWFVLSILLAFLLHIIAKYVTNHLLRTLER